MGADFVYIVIPACIVTPERKKKLIKTVKHWTDCGGRVAVPDALKAIDEYANWQVDNLHYTNCRSVSYIDIEGCRYYITGGMTWGDPPTDTYSTMLLLENVRDVLAPWAKEDFKRIKSRCQPKTAQDA